MIILAYLFRNRNGILTSKTTPPHHYALVHTGGVVLYTLGESQMEVS